MAKKLIKSAVLSEKHFGRVNDMWGGLFEVKTLVPVQPPTENVYHLTYPQFETLMGNLWDCAEFVYSVKPIKNLKK